MNKIMVKKFLECLKEKNTLSQAGLLAWEKYSLNPNGSEQQNESWKEALYQFKGRK